jgi:hypothetical protein
MSVRLPMRPPLICSGAMHACQRGCLLPPADEPVSATRSVNRRIRHWRHRQGQSEVEQLGAALGQHDVVYQVAMHDPVPVGCSRARHRFRCRF